MSLVEKLFGSFSDRELKKVNPITKQVLALEPKYQAMSDADLQAQTAMFKQQLAEGKTLDDILPDAFAVCREAAWRVLGMKHFPVQVAGGIALHRGDIAEMQTGEGKTLVATLPAYLNALTGEGVHIVTVNDYLAKRDSEWMGKLYRWLGLTVGLIVQGMDGDARRAAYNADITYGTNNEFGFDYLRDNMVTYKANMVQRGHAYAIVDEVDSILIDEARTPLIISGRGEDSSSLYTQVDRFVRTLRKSVVVELEDKVSTDEQADGDYVVDEKHKTCTLTAAGIKKAEAYFKVENLAAAENMTLAHHIDQAIKAYGVMQRDIDYVVKDGQVIIVDEFTGRLMIGRRYNEGLHQAIEAKEGVKIAAESKTLATITFQNYFRMYKKLSGMTGTARTEATEFTEIYGLNIVSVPTNRPVQRKDYPDAIYKTVEGKYRAVIEQVMECHKNGQPVLVGTVSVEKSEILAKMLQRHTRDFNVLNAKNHEREAEIVAQAGKKGAITIATNMAGRGTDIMLGGNAEFMAKAQMRKEHFCENLLNPDAPQDADPAAVELLLTEANGHGETTDANILAARQRFEQLYAQYKPAIDAEADEVRFNLILRSRYDFELYRKEAHLPDDLYYMKDADRLFFLRATGDNYDEIYDAIGKLHLFLLGQRRVYIPGYADIDSQQQENWTMIVMAADNERELEGVYERLSHDGRNLIDPANPLFIVGTSIERLRLQPKPEYTVYDWFCDCSVHIVRPDV